MIFNKIRTIFTLLAISFSTMLSAQVVKEIAVSQKRRAVMLETQSCNTNAIGFYLHEGFELIGFDTCCYTNDDIGKKEVRLNLGYFFHKEPRRW